MHSLQQLSLPFKLPLHKTFNNFLAGNNAELINSLQQIATGHGDQILYVWGKTQSGRTHLLCASCELAQQTQRSVSYLPLREIMQFDVSVLDDLENYDLVCVDDVDAIAGNRLWEEAVMNLFNRLRAFDKRLIVSSHALAKDSGLLLADLISRLNWGVTYHLQPLNDEDKLQAFCLHAKQRGLEIPLEAAEFIWRRVPRDLNTLMDILDQIDEATLMAKRKPTVPFIKQLFGW